MANTWVPSALWVGLAVIATLLAIWFRISKTLSEIVVGTVAQLVIGAALGCGGLLRKLETLVNSYADAYRVQIHRISATSDAVVYVGQLQSDLDLVRNWNARSTAEFAEKRA